MTKDKMLYALRKKKVNSVAVSDNCEAKIIKKEDEKEEVKDEEETKNN